MIIIKMKYGDWKRWFGYLPLYFIYDDEQYLGCRTSLEQCKEFLETYNDI